MYIIEGFKQIILGTVVVMIIW